MRIHLVGVCGAGMGSLAGLLKEAGNEVSGCDRAFDPPMGPMLEELGIELCPGFDPAHITPELDLAVIGNVCRSSNPEAARAGELGIARKSFPQALGEMFLESRKPIVVAGTHGKTTTTALAGHLLHVCGLDPSYLLGGIVAGSGRSFRLGGGPHFVVEGDEYDSAFFDKRPKFVHYRPWIAVLTSVEYDHADIYPDRESYVEAFRLLVGMVPEGGYLVACRDDPQVVELSAGCRGKVLWYGFDEKANMRVETVAVDETATTAGFVLDGKPLGRVRLPLFGQHNCQNAAGALVAAILSGAEAGKALSALPAFPGVARRMNVLGEARGVIVVDDFAHHPTEVRKTLEAAKARWPGRRVVAVFEPRTNTSRRAVFQRDYARAFDSADRVVLVPPYQAAAIAEEERLDVWKLAEDLGRAGKDVEVFNTTQEALDSLAGSLEAGQVVLSMSNGRFDDFPSRLLSLLQNVTGGG